MPRFDPNSLPEPPVSPPEPEANPQITRKGYEYHTPQYRHTVVEATIKDIENLEECLLFMDLSDPEDFDNFRTTIGQTREFDSYEALERIKGLVEDYLRDKVNPWLEETP